MRDAAMTIDIAPTWLTGDPVPIAPATASDRTTSPRTSSMIAAPMMVVPVRDRKSCSSRSVAALMPTLVAVRMAPAEKRRSVVVTQSLDHDVTKDHWKGHATGGCQEGGLPDGAHCLHVRLESGDCEHAQGADTGQDGQLAVQLHQAQHARPDQAVLQRSDRTRA